MHNYSLLFVAVASYEQENFHNANREAFCFCWETNIFLFSSSINIKHISYLSKEVGYSFLHPDYELINKEMLEEAKACNLGINTWTVNDPEEVKNLMAWNVGGVISNCPDMCLKVLGR